MNVAIAVKEFPPDAVGGMETQTERMATALVDRGHAVTVYTKRYGVHDDSDVDYEVVRVPNVRASPFLSDLTYLVGALLLLLRRSGEHDVLQCMMFYPVGFLGYVAKRLTGLPYFAWIRGGDYYLMRDVRWKRWMMRAVLGDALVLAQSPEIKRDVARDFSSVECEIEVLGNGVTLPDRTASTEGREVLFVGRLAPKKGLDHLLAAMAAVDADARLTLVGDGSERERLEERAGSAGVDVEFVGEVPPGEVAEHYRGAALFVLPSVEGEGLPNAVLEAMAHGLPVVATTSGGVPSLVENGETGFVVAMRDEAALAERITYLLERPDERRRLGRNAREFVAENYSWDVLADELEAVYGDVVSRG